jgi:hypothetical protein
MADVSIYTKVSFKTDSDEEMVFLHRAGEALVQSISTIASGQRLIVKVFFDETPSSTTYYLNHAAMLMCAENNIALPNQELIPESELPQNLGTQWRMPYSRKSI